MLTVSDMEEIFDARRGQGRMYDLPHVLLCCILAVAAGADSYRAIVRFIDARLDWLEQHAGLRWRRAPSHTGLRMILLGLDQPAVEQALRRRASAALEAEAAGGVLTIAIDGKTLRASLDRFADVAALQGGCRPSPAGSAWCSGRWRSPMATRAARLPPRSASSRSWA